MSVFDVSLKFKQLGSAVIARERGSSIDEENGLIFLIR